jgi:pimeloyl-ACP methyl ester carboxylesterase
METIQPNHVQCREALHFAHLQHQNHAQNRAHARRVLSRSSIRSRHIANVNGMTVHILEAGYETPGRPAVLLLHGFPELAYSWRKVIPSLAAAGYHVIAPDQRGYSRTTGWDDSYDADPDQFRILNMTRDAIGLVYALGHRSVAMVVGHNAGAPVAARSALIRPDIFRALTIMSSPFEGAPSLPFDTSNGAPPAAPDNHGRRA